MELLFLHRCLALLALLGCVTQALRRSAPRGDAIFLSFFSAPLRNPHKKQLLTLENFDCIKFKWMQPEKYAF